MGMEDSLTVLIILFLVGFCGVFGYIMAANTFPMFAGMPGIPVNFISQMESVFTFFDGIFALVLAILFVGAIYLGTLARSHPFLALFGVFSLVFLTFGSYLIQVFWQSFASGAPQVISAVALFPITNFVLSNLAPVAMILDLALLVAYFIKPGVGTPVASGGY